ncbi:hypothetical protein FJT64_007019 [Amphibalanus amphitrite]|uniref:Protein quiver n=1 Tax=Amphibalanus amphitrite TaxID=1232801 RepID=A0A6A4VX88_AMPAM|nr:hypothetical protein FJT64_007019 [Amphibalanus amphitrite]
MAHTPSLLPLLVLVLVVVLACGPPPAKALRCYACAPLDTSQQSLATRLVLKSLPLCDNFKPHRPQTRFIMDCPAMSNACIKTDKLRTCFVSLRKKERCEDGRCTCLTDLCNGAPPAAGAAWLLMAPLAASLAAGRQNW